MNPFILMNNDFVSAYSTLCRIIVTIALFFPLVTIIKELKTKDGLVQLRFLIVGFLSSMMIGKMSLGVFQASKIISNIPEWLSNFATIVTSNTDLAIAICIALMAAYFKIRINIIRKALETGEEATSFQFADKFNSLYTYFATTLIGFLLLLIVVFMIAIYQNVADQRVSINEIYIHVKTNEVWEEISPGELINEN